LAVPKKSLYPVEKSKEFQDITAPNHIYAKNVEERYGIAKVNALSAVSLLQKTIPKTPVSKIEAKTYKKVSVHKCSEVC